MCIGKQIRGPVMSLVVVLFLQLLFFTVVGAQTRCNNGWEEIYTDLGVFSHCAPSSNTPSGGTSSGGGSFSEGNGVNGSGAGSAPTTGGGQTVGGTGQCAGLTGQSLLDCQSFGSGAAGGPTGNGIGGPTGNGAGGPTGNGVTGMTELINPLKFDSLTTFLLAVIDVLLMFALPVIIFFIMYAGYLFVTAAGNDGKISTAKSALLWAVIGGVIILGAKLIITVIQGTITSFGP